MAAPFRFGTRSSIRGPVRLGQGHIEVLPDGSGAEQEGDRNVGLLEVLEGAADRLGALLRIEPHLLAVDDDDLAVRVFEPKLAGSFDGQGPFERLGLVDGLEKVLLRDIRGQVHELPVMRLDGSDSVGRGCGRR